ncbi:MAG: hypothetical protein H6577_15130 [Lewinellaceae bacterium]|nr:hypothetical protein [Saprospiraceae bacterium]MCB9339461.1 hypothetical protein [Lewinellaceae bacterium]
MKSITIQILNPEDETLVLAVLEAFQKSGKITLGTAGEKRPDPDSFDKTDEEILDLLDRADREKGIPYEEHRKRFGL